MRAETDNSGSILLARDENEQVHRLLGNRCQVNNSLFYVLRSLNVV
jgi:hypothetical protein